MKRFLITTALEETWRDDEPVLFLGEWCRRFTRTARWSALDAETLPYHWNDRAKLLADYRYLASLHERLLVELGTELNRIHGVEHRTRYWRILIGSWLGYFTQILFDRWSSLRQAAESHELSGTAVLAAGNGIFVPNDMEHFTRLYAGDAWNHHIYASILERCPALNIPVTQLKAQPPRASETTLSWKRRVKRFLASGYARVAGLLSRDEDAFLIATYLPYFAEIALNRRFGQVPQLWRSVSVPRVDADAGQRHWSVPGESRTEFEACLRAVIPQQIPTAYLEGYHALMRQMSALQWPKRPKVIWTSNAHLMDDTFKAWAAQKNEDGTSLVIGQHGGHYGTGLFCFPEDHEIAISDMYLSWGWNEPPSRKIKPVGQVLFDPPDGARHGGRQSLLLVQSNVPRQSVPLYSSAISSQMLDYFEDQYSFVSHLPRDLRAAVTVRLYPQDYGWDQAARWRLRFPDLTLEDGSVSMKELIRRCRIYISTYNASTFLESFSADVPTIIFWNTNHWELRDSAVPYFDELERVGIFHRSAVSAARQVETVWNDVDSWWNSNLVRDVLGPFKARYCHRPADFLGDVEQALRDAIGAVDCSNAP